MVTKNWKSFGASVRGPGHVRTSLPNQDAFCHCSSSCGDVAVVSDGVGSCPTSEYGAKAVCRSVCIIAEKNDFHFDSPQVLFEQIHAQWLLSIRPYNPGASSATCLFAICPNDSPIIVGMLGDGLIAVLKTDGTYMELGEDKKDVFSNQTGAISEKTKPDQWKYYSIALDECIAILLCTDGVADDLLPEQHENFFRHIFEHGRKCPVSTATREVRKMLENWPVPKHSDDKTLVCMYKSEEEA